jgi:predicted transcriptional regulator
MSSIILYDAKSESMEASKIIVSEDVLKLRQFAELKDILLNYMLDPNKNICLLSIMFKKCNPDNLPKKEFELCLSNLMSDGRALPVISSGTNVTIYYITDSGKRFLRGGGYKKEFDDNRNEWLERELEDEKRKEKLDLEILSLRAGMKHNKSTRVMTIIALIISGSTFIYLIIKDILLKIF